jgi:hypothetical protein
MQFGFNLPLSGPSASPAMLERLAAEGDRTLLSNIAQRGANIDRMM